MPRTQKPVKVLYIAGFERSGSTFLTKLLGELDHTFAAGELRGIWHCSFRDNQDCGCGKPFRECELWQEIASQAYGGFDEIDPAEMIAERPGRRHTPLMLLPGSNRMLERTFRRYIDRLDRLYVAIADKTGSRVIVDSSKTPLYGYVLGLAPSVDLHVLHLVRDPRGTQCSNLRRARQGHKQLRNYSVARSSMLWDMLHVTQELFGRGRRDRYLRIRYEDLVSDPIQTVEAIKEFLGEPGIGVPAIEDGQIQLNTNHTVSGNRNRTETGSVPLRLDDRWRTELEQRNKLVVTGLTLPLLLRYGYGR